MSKQVKCMFLLHDEDNEKINTIQNLFNGNRSDIVRRAIGLLYDYLIKDRLPDGSFVPIPQETLEEFGLTQEDIDRERQAILEREASEG